MGLGHPAQRDALADLQVNLVRDVLRVVKAALIDERIPPATVSRVINLILYGTCPHPADMEVREMDTRLRRITLETGRPHWPDNLEGESPA